MVDGSKVMAEKNENATRKIARRRGKSLERWEIAVVKAMLTRSGYNDQDILAFFTRPTRSVNHRAIAEIRTETKHKAVKPVDEETLNDFLSTWPEVDPDTGLSIRGDELLIKAREAMIAAVHVFNSTGLTFRAELYIVSAIVAWTYLLHAFYKREGVPYTYKDRKTPHGADKYWDLSQCIQTGRCPLPEGAKTNLCFLIEIRNEIEHQSTSRIDDAIGAELQSCALNFNDAMKGLFGLQYGLEKRIPIALQFVSFGMDQRSRMKKASSLPTHVSSFISAFENGLTDEEVKDPAFRLKVAFVPVAAKKAAGADMAVVTVKPGSDEAEKVGDVIFKEVNRTRYPPMAVVKKVKAAGFPKFKIHHHTQLWKSLNATASDKGFGCIGDYGNFVWFDKWLDRVIAHCEEKGDLFR